MTSFKLFHISEIEKIYPCFQSKIFSESKIFSFFLVKKRMAEGHLIEKAIRTIEIANKGYVRRRSVVATNDISADTAFEETPSGVRGTLSNIAERVPRFHRTNKIAARRVQPHDIVKQGAIALVLKLQDLVTANA